MKRVFGLGLLALGMLAFPPCIARALWPVAPATPAVAGPSARGERVRPSPPPPPQSVGPKQTASAAR